MINSTDLSGKLALDVKDMAALRESARQNSPEALKTAAKQFEALFMNMIMKSMRDASPQDGMFNNEQTKMYTTMLDQQISQKLANRGVGLADVLVRQLSNNRSVVPEPGKEGQAPTEGNAALDASGNGKLNPTRLAQIAAFQEQMRMQNEGADGGLPPALLARQAEYGSAAAIDNRSRTGRPAHVRAFEDKLAQSADEASRTTGIPAKFMLGQAALETGWGKHEIRMADGSSSHNLFGIKAGPGWRGKVVEAATTEYVNGVPQTRIEKFRAYDSYADSFRDYARLLARNPRYENVIANAQDAASFAQGLQRAGYATDPNYATKLTRIIRQSLSA
jgi:flagellar protein FlgJ